MTKIFAHENTEIGDSKITCAELHMDDGACISDYCTLRGKGSVYIGTYAQIEPYVALMTTVASPMGHMSDMMKDESRRRTRTDDIIIEDHAFIGMHSTIMPGVVIGEGAVVGAYSYITQNVPAWTVSHQPKGKPKVSRRRIDDGVDIKPITGVGFKRYRANQDTEEL